MGQYWGQEGATKLGYGTEPNSLLARGSYNQGPKKTKPVGPLNDHTTSKARPHDALTPPFCGKVLLTTAQKTHDDILYKNAKKMKR